MLSFFEGFILLGVWFEVLTSLLFIFLCFTVFSERNITLSLLGIFVYGLLAYFIWNLNIFNYISNHPIEFLFCILSYLTIGLIWSFFKWFLYVNSKKDEIRQHFKTASELWENRIKTQNLTFHSIFPGDKRNKEFEYEENVDTKEIEEDNIYIIKKANGVKLLVNKDIGFYYQTECGSIKTKEEYFKAKENRLDFVKPENKIEMIFNFILFWPFSVLLYLFKNLIKDLINGIINIFSKVYTSISNYFINKIINEGK